MTSPLRNLVVPSRLGDDGVSLAAQVDMDTKTDFDLTKFVVPPAKNEDPSSTSGNMVRVDQHENVNVALSYLLLI